MGQVEWSSFEVMFIVFMKGGTAVSNENVGECASGPPASARRDMACQTPATLAPLLYCLAEGYHAALKMPHTDHSPLPCVYSSAPQFVRPSQPRKLKCHRFRDVFGVMTVC